MKRRALALGLLLLLFIAMPFLGMRYAPNVRFKPDFPAISSFALRQQAFILFMAPKINAANAQILQTRMQILSLLAKYQASGFLSYADRSWLNEIASVYEIPHFNYQNQKDMNELLSRVDIVPTSLVLAQSGDESGWGTSRFAVEADNFFGQYCYVQGCGILPLGSPPHSREAQKFHSADDAINSYLYNINTNPAYAALREMRAELRAHNQPIVGFRLTPYLTHYSILGDEYILRISSVIVNHNLMQYDVFDNNF